MKWTRRRAKLLAMSWRRGKPLVRIGVAAALALGLAAASGEAQAPSGRAAADPGATSSAEAALTPGGSAPRARIGAGETFPSLSLQALRKGSEKAAPLDLAADLGKRPVVFVYFLIGFEVSEEILKDVDRFLKEEGAGKVAFYPVVRLGKRHEVTELAERMKLLGIDAPVVIDDDSKIQGEIGAGVVPDITLVDAAGTLCFTRARSLGQPVLGDTDVRGAIRMAARGEEPPAVKGLLQYFPASDLVGQRYRDFVLRSYLDDRDVRLSDHVKPDRVTAIFYWSPDCPYSRQAMPGFVIGNKTYGGKFLDLVTVVKPGKRAEVEAYAKEQGLQFPILEDRDHRFAGLYRVLSTPTLFILKPDGVVDSVYTSGRVNYYPVLATKIRTLLPRPSPRPAPPKS